MDELPGSIECMIDTHGILKVIDTLSDVCRLKAQHLQENWGDCGASQHWELVANTLGKDPYKYALRIAEHYGQVNCKR